MLQLKAGNPSFHKEMRFYYFMVLYRFVRRIFSLMLTSVFFFNLLSGYKDTLIEE